MSVHVEMNDLEKLEKEIMDFVDKKQEEYENLYTKLNPSRWSKVLANARFSYLSETKSMRKLMDK